MKNIQHAINISAPNLVNICVDESFSGEISGRMYHCYQSDPVLFSNLVQLLRIMEKLFDDIQFPQSATKSRSFFDANMQIQKEKIKLADQKEIIQWTGGKSTFIIIVQFRQNSTWQGELYWVEKEEKQYFSSTLDLIKILDGDLALAEIEKRAAEEKAIAK